MDKDDGTQDFDSHLFEEILIFPALNFSLIVDQQYL